MCIIKQGVTKSSNRVMHVSCLQFYYSQIYVLFESVDRSSAQLWSMFVSPTACHIMRMYAVL